ncbi:MAG: shikimate dehydrogenase [Azoarcus sp.]|jgi:shikimate dehydrogenase|nr:shikimate dehydrogenase [Azoarcus sp.]
MDRYAVIGNPVEHSKSPRIHALFVRQTGQDMRYDARCAPRDGFAAAVQAFRGEGGRGANVTVPFKLDACALADALSTRAQAAGAVNTLTFTDEGIAGDNTDGVGLLRDLIVNLACPLAGQRVLLLGAGGAARGVLVPLLDARPAKLVIANRSSARARELHAALAAHGGQAAFRAGGFADLAGDAFDVVINATSASLEHALPPLPQGVFAPGAFAYDLMYGEAAQAFLAASRAAGAARCADGLGMLVEQAAESFAIWRGVRPDSGAVLAELRRELAGAAR